MAHSFTSVLLHCVFSIGISQLEETTRYIATQREHHRQQSFQEEHVAFLEKSEVDYDPGFLRK